MMEIENILKKSREIWHFKMKLPDIVIAMGTIFGDICRWTRGAKKDVATHTDQELKKELGNMIVSTVRWCDDLGYDPDECVEIALEAQKNFQKQETT